LHPVSASPATGIEVDIFRIAPDMLRLSFSTRGDLANVIVSPQQLPTRTDGLWRHTCFEAFLGAGEGYYEFNFSPSSQWAAYRFDSYRNGMGAAEIGTPEIEGRSNPDSYTLQASLELDRLPDLPSEASWRLALSALIEDQNGRKSYWALAHPPGKPDFHHADSFALEFSPAVPS